MNQRLENRLTALELARKGARPAVDPRLEAAISGAFRVIGGFDAMVAMLSRIDAGTDTGHDRAALAAIPPYDDSPTELLRLLVRVNEMF